MVGREVGGGGGEELQYSSNNSTHFFPYWMVQSQIQMPNEWINDQQGYHSPVHCVETSFPFKNRLLDFCLFSGVVSGI